MDDAHLLDGASATLVHHLAAHDSVSVVLTIRTGEPSPDAIEVLWKDGLAERIELQPLSRRDVQFLCEAALGGIVDGGLVERLWTLSRGNALYLRDLVLEATA